MHKHAPAQLRKIWPHSKLAAVEAETAEIGRRLELAADAARREREAARVAEGDIAELCGAAPNGPAAE